MAFNIIKHEVDKSVIGQRDNDGYVNATSLCQAAGKLWAHYYQTQSTKDFLAELSSFIGIQINDLVQPKKGPPANGGGTWVHPQVATHLAQWASPKFAVAVSKWVVDWVQAEKTKPAVPVTNQASQALTDWMAVATLFKVPTHYAQIEGVKMVQTKYGVDYSPLLLQSPVMDSIPESDVMLEPTELAPYLGVSSGVAANKTLFKYGLQIKTQSGWVPTAAGVPLSQKHSWSSGSKSGYNLKWNKNGVLSHLNNLQEKK